MSDYDSFNSERGFYFDSTELPGNVYFNWDDLCVKSLMLGQDNNYFTTRLKLAKYEGFSYVKDFDFV